MAKPLLIGLTGSIGMGKTETAKLFSELGIPVYDSDAAVHHLYDTGGAAVPVIADNFPGAVKEARVDRSELRRQVAADPTALDRLNRLVHPLVLADREKFLRKHEGEDMVVLDIPLLFETGADSQMDVLVVASAPTHIQRERVLARPGMSDVLFDSLVQKQLPDAEKRAKAHFVVVTDKGREHALDQVRMIVAELKTRQEKN